MRESGKMMDADEAVRYQRHWRRKYGATYKYEARWHMRTRGNTNGQRSSIHFNR